MFQKLKMKRMVALLLAVCLLAGGFSVRTEAAAKTASSEAAKIVKANVNKGDSAQTKLKKMFSYVEKNYGYARATGFKANSGWEKKYALEMYNKKKGSCYHFAAAYGFLAKKATGYQVRIGVGKTNGFGNGLQGHAWTEVRIGSTWYICDTNLDKFAAKSSGKYSLKKRDSLKKVYNNFKGVKYYTVP